MMSATGLPNLNSLRSFAKLEKSATSLPNLKHSAGFIAGYSKVWQTLQGSVRALPNLD